MWGCCTLVFSSSATVYGDPHAVPITEDFPRSHTNPYGHTKLMIEDMLASPYTVAVLRYFNPVGAHPSGLIGEDPSGIPNNLMPYVAQVAIGKRPYLNVYGNDYFTLDGTGVRDYIHVQDVAAGHVAALHTLLGQGESFTVNLGTGLGSSVLEVVQAFEQASGQSIPYQIVPRRLGDVAQCYADPALARSVLIRLSPPIPHQWCFWSAKLGASHFRRPKDVRIGGAGVQIGHIVGCAAWWGRQPDKHGSEPAGLERTAHAGRYVRRCVALAER